MPATDQTSEMIKAAINGDVERVRLLLPFSKPKTTESKALRLAANGGHLDVVKLLIPVSNPKVNHSSPLRIAVREGHEEMALILLPVSDVKVAGDVLAQTEEWGTFDRLAKIVPEKLRRRWLNENPEMLPLATRHQRLLDQQQQALDRSAKTPPPAGRLPFQKRRVRS